MEFIDDKADALKLFRELGEQYDEISRFNSKTFRVQKNRKWFLVERSDNKVKTISNQYDYIDDVIYNNNLVKVVNKDKYGIINNKGVEIAPCIYDHIGNFYDRIAKVMREGKWGFINTKGKEFVKCIYDNVDYFDNGFAIVEKDKKYGIVNMRGKEIEPCIYDEIKNRENYFLCSVF